MAVTAHPEERAAPRPSAPQFPTNLRLIPHTKPFKLEHSPGKQPHLLLYRRVTN